MDKVAVYSNAFNILKERVDELDNIEKKSVIDDVTGQIRRALSDENIHVGDLSEKPCRFKDKGTPVTLVLEEDNNVRWYAIPERSDLKLLDIPVRCR